MSTGSLTQLAALGSQDQYLHIESQVTFFKSQYRRHTPFAIEPVTMQFSQTPQWGQRGCYCVIARNGDLLSKSWLKIELPALAHSTPEVKDFKYRGARYCDSVGHAMLDSLEVQIGGTTIDKMPGSFMECWAELTQTEEKKAIDHLIGRSGSEAELASWAEDKQTLWIPLQFWFTRHLQCALPLIALQYHEVKIQVDFKNLDEVVAKTGGRTGGFNKSDFRFNGELVCNLIYCDEPERKTFAASSHEYLIDVLQFPGDIECSGTSTTYSAFFNHPTSEIIFTFLTNAASDAKEPFCYSALGQSYNNAGDPLISARLQFNGYDRIKDQPAEYFREIVPAQCHTSIPSRPVYVFSFALEPEDFRPSGSVNLSRIDNVKLVTNHVNFSAESGLSHPNDSSGTNVKGAKLRVYARSKNVLRIKSGMGGLAYAN